MDHKDPNIVNFPGVRMRRPDVTPSEAPEEVSAPPLETPTMTALDLLRQFVETGDCEGFIVVARQKSTGLFYSDIAYPGNAVPPVHAFSYMGALDLIKNELADTACAAPSVLHDGSLLSPGVNL